MIHNAFEKTKEKLLKENLWFPFPCFISLYLALILIKFLSFDLDFRDSSQKNLPNINSESFKNGALWLSITETKDIITITTNDKKQFLYKLDDKEKKGLLKFDLYLKEMIKKHALSFILSKKEEWDQLNVTLSMDKKIKFSHIAPLIYALAEAGITRYGFETKIPIKNKV